MSNATAIRIKVLKSAAAQHRDAATRHPHMNGVHTRKADELEAKVAEILAAIE